MSDQTLFQMHPIGSVQQNDEGFTLEILEQYRPALKQLEHFSHVLVFWWADQFDDDLYRNLLQGEPPYAPGKMTGVFATRSPYRPNPIAVTTCAILDVDETRGIVRVPWIDAFDGTAIVDLKAYFPVSDRVRAAHIPEWLSDWPEWLEDADQLTFEDPGE